MFGGIRDVMVTIVRVQILNKVVWILHSGNILGKGMNSSFLSQPRVK